MASTRALIDHEEIRRWAEARGARPARVKSTARRKGDVGVIRLDFPGYSGAESLQPISWNEWFRQFDQNNLALLVQDKTKSGRVSNFNKLVSREKVQAPTRPSRRGARSRATAPVRARRSNASRKAASSRSKRPAAGAGARSKAGTSRARSR